MTKPFISIITVVYNADLVLEDTIKSILSQKDENIEYIVIDGASTDGTIDIIKTYKDRISNWISESDAGIYDAMNKGILLAKGDYVCFINSGDLLLEIPKKKLEDSTADLVVFPVKLSNGTIFTPKLDFSLKIRNTLPHQGCFYKNSSELKFDTKFKVFSDFCLNQKLYKQGKIIEVYARPVVAYHDMGGISHDKKYSSEIFKVVNDNFGLQYQILSWMYFKKQGLKMRLKKILK
jgi:glycosyltransferase involved in cell wall biosynthesis